jgi:predicted esterase
MGSSDIDDWVPEERVHETARIFKKMGADITVRIYKGMGHLINDDEIEHAKTILRQVMEHS